MPVRPSIIGKKISQLSSLPGEIPANSIIEIEDVDSGYSYKLDLGQLALSDLSNLGNSIDSSVIADGSITTTKIADNAVTSDKLDSSVTDLIQSLDTVNFRGYFNPDTGLYPETDDLTKNDFYIISKHGKINLTYVIPGDILYYNGSSFQRIRTNVETPFLYLTKSLDGITQIPEFTVALQLNDLEDNGNTIDVPLSSEIIKLDKDTIAGIIKLPLHNSVPDTYLEGQLYFNTLDNNCYIYHNGEFKLILDVSSIINSVGDATTSLSALEGRVGTNETDISALEGRVETNETDISALQSSLGDVETNFDGSRPITRTVSGLQGITPGTTTVVEFLDSVFYPKVDSTISLSVNPSTNELGVSTSVSAVMNYTSNDYAITLAELREGATVVDSIQDITENESGSLTYTASYANTQSFTAWFEKDNATTKTSTRTASFYDPYYHGELTLTTINNIIASGVTRSELSTLLTKSVSSKRNNTKSFELTAQRMVYCFPDNYGNLSSIIDQNGYNITSSFSYSTFTYTREDSSTVNYRIYYNDSDISLTGFSVTFNI